MQSRHHLATLTFDGPHYADHGLDLDDLQELAAYRKIVVETAIELWRRHNPGRDRLPKGFEEGIVLKFYQLTAGSATVPIERVVDESGQDVPFRIEDEVEEAAEIIDHALAAASEDSAPPERLPASVVPMIQKWGETLRPGSSMLLQSCRSPLSVGRVLADPDKIRNRKEKPMSTTGPFRTIFRTESETPPHGADCYSKEVLDSRGRQLRVEHYHGGRMTVLVTFQYFEKHGIPIVVKTFSDVLEDGELRQSARNTIQTIGGVSIVYIYGSRDQLMYINIEHPVQNGDRRVLSLEGKIDSDEILFNDGARSGSRELDEMLDVLREKSESNFE